MRVTPIGGFFIWQVVLSGAIGCYAYCASAILLLCFFSVFQGRDTRIGRWTFNHVTDLCQEAWFGFVGFLLQFVLDVKCSYVLRGSKNGAETNSLTGEGASSQPTLEDFLGKPASSKEVPRRKFRILIMNHRTRIDWMLLWAFLAHARGALSSLKIVIKGSLSKVPIWGWAMQTFRCLLLSRKWEHDQEHIKKVVQYHLDDENQEFVNLLIFAEGSDLSQENIDKSHAYAEKNNLKKFRYVLNPRTTGLVALKNCIGVENIESVVDITMGFTDRVHGERPSEACLFSGELPPRVHFLCTQHKFARDHDGQGEPTKDSPSADGNNNNSRSEGDIPTSDEGFAKWIISRFEQKEVELSGFYTTHPVEFCPKMLAATTEGSMGIVGQGQLDHFPKLFLLKVLATFTVPLLLAAVYIPWVIVGLWVIAWSAIFVWVTRQHGSFDDAFLYRDDTKKSSRHHHPHHHHRDRGDSTASGGKKD